MRYTTVIDITELPPVWRNERATRMYLYLCLRCGYHDDDRDIVTCSRVQLAAELGMTEDAARHALAMLQRHGLLAPMGTPRAGERRQYRVKKWVAVAKPGSRGSAEDYQRDFNDKVEREVKRRLESARNEEFKRCCLQAFDSLTDEQLQQWRDELQQGKNVRHCGLSIRPTRAGIEFITNYINNRKENSGK